MGSRTGPPIQSYPELAHGIGVPGPLGEVLQSTVVLGERQPAVAWGYFTTTDTSPFPEEQSSSAAAKVFSLGDTL